MKLARFAPNPLPRNAGLLGGQDDPDEVFASSASDPEPDGMASDEKPDPDCEALPPNMDAVGVSSLGLRTFFFGACFKVPKDILQSS